MPDSKIVRRKDAWMKAWENNPPADTIVDGSLYDKQKKEEAEKLVENVDYVCCKICGYRSSNISRHIGREHELSPDLYIEKYGSPVYGSKFKEKRFNPWLKKS